MRAICCLSLLGRVHPTASRLVRPLQVGDREVRVQYGGEGSSQSCGVSTPTNPANCTVSIKIKKDMDASADKPIYVYYELQNFYQNHRRYVSSRFDRQLKGDLFTEETTELRQACDPMVKAADGRILHPCGLIANSYFSGEARARVVIGLLLLARLRL